MDKVQKIFIFISSSYLFLFYANTVRADLIIPGEIVNPFITVLIGLLLTIWIEWLVAKKIFHGDKKAIKAVLLANLMTYSLVAIFQILRGIDTTRGSAGILFLIVFFEPVIILLEAIFISKYLGKSLSNKKALKYSFLLNLASMGPLILYVFALFVWGFFTKTPSY